MAKIHLVLKYTFFVLIVFGAGLVIERLVGIKRWWNADLLTADDLFYNVSSSMTYKNFHSDLNRHYQKCVTQPTKPFCLLTANRRLEIFRNGKKDSPNVEEIERQLQNITSSIGPRRRKIHSLLKTFTKVVKTNHVKVLLIEPSMLFCLLSPAKKFDMLSGGFNPGKFKGSRNVVTVGILDQESKTLETSNFTTEILSAGFKIIKFRRSIDKEFEKSFETVHYFFVLHDVAVHAVIFYTRNSYVWHAGLDPKEIDFEDLLFVNEGIFQNFTLFPLDLAGTSISRIFLPIDIQYFMKEMETSRILECRFNSSGIANPVTHPSLTKDQLRKRVVITLKELNNVLAPRVIFFWLWSKSLLGWFKECDALFYSTTFDLALAFKSVEGLNFTELIDDNEFLKIENVNQTNSEFKLKINCHGLHINIFILHEDKDMLWYRHNEDHDRLTYPLFKLCSSQLLGEKIHVPCNTNDILKLDLTLNGTNLASENGVSENNLIPLNGTES